MGNQSSNLRFKIIYSKGDAIELLADAENVDFYLKKCREDRNNMISRKENNYAPNNMTIKEYKFFEIVIENAKDKIPIRLMTDLSEIRLIQLMPTADGGMPHTRPDSIICYPDISKFFSVSTLIHELWHIHQRIYKQLWNEVFEKLHWKEWNGRLPLSLEKNRRYNPDTIDSPFYVFKDKTNKNFTVGTGATYRKYSFIDNKGDFIADPMTFPGDVYSRSLFVERMDNSLNTKNQIIRASIKKLIKK